jgi:hypothetical protein
MHFQNTKPYRHVFQFCNGNNCMLTLGESHILFMPSVVYEIKGGNSLVNFPLTIHSKMP